MSTDTNHDRGRPEIPNEQLLTELQRLAEKLDRTPTIKLMNRKGKYSSRTYYNTFDSWNEALKKAGLTPNVTSPDNPELLTELQRLADDLDETPRRRDMDELGKYSSNIYNTRFDSWNEAIEHVGLTPRPKGRQPLTPDELITELQQLADDLGHAPSTSEMNEHGEYCHVPYYNVFGSWPDALDAADLEA